MKGIILAGGSGTRLHPLTLSTSKQLLPIYDKPMIYYPLSVLMLANIREVLVISTPDDIERYKQLLGNGSRIGIKISYKVQPKPEGLAQAFLIGKDFIGSDDVCLVLGDNIFYGHGFSKLLKNACDIVKKKYASVFGYYVNNPSEFGVVEFDNQNEAISIEEKPTNPKSNYAVVGLYFYPNDVIKYAQKVKPSNRGELEISSINQMFLKKKKLSVQIMGRGFTWLDTGTHDSLLQASNFISTIEKHGGFKVACIEEIAFKKGYINKEELQKISNELKKTKYGKYLQGLIK